jgi:predicted nucleic acid-binding protein
MKIYLDVCCLNRPYDDQTKDRIHIACAEEAGADVFLSTDDRLVRAAKRQQEATKVEIENPLTWLQSIVK